MKPSFCPHCKFLADTFNGCQTNSEYWLFTEMFVYLHNGKDYCTYLKEDTMTDYAGLICALRHLIRGGTDYEKELPEIIRKAEDKILPIPEGWRRLLLDEKIQVGDKVGNVNLSSPSSSYWSYARHLIGATQAHLSQTYIRKIANNPSVMLNCRCAIPKASADMLDAMTHAIINGANISFTEAEVKKIMKAMNNERNPYNMDIDGSDFFEAYTLLNKKINEYSKARENEREPVIPEGWRKLDDKEILQKGDLRWDYNHFGEPCTTPYGELVGGARSRWHGPYCVIRKIEETLSDEYLDEWVPRMEEIVKAEPGRANLICNKWIRVLCTSCPSHRPGFCCEHARAFLTRPDVLAWKERQKANEWPKWITVASDWSPTGRRVMACYSQDDWNLYAEPRLATAAEIDAVRRG